MMRRRRTAPELEPLPPVVEDLYDAIAEAEPTKCQCGNPVFADRCCAVCGENVFDAIRRAKAVAGPLDPTHLVPDTGHARWRVSRCGVACAEGRLEYERLTHGRGSSTLANVDCEACLRLAPGVSR